MANINFNPGIIRDAAAQLRQIAVLIQTASHKLQNAAPEVPGGDFINMARTLLEGFPVKFERFAEVAETAVINYAAAERKNNEDLEGLAVYQDYIFIGGGVRPPGFAAGTDRAEITKPDFTFFSGMELTGVEIPSAESIRGTEFEYGPDIEFPRGVLLPDEFNLPQFEGVTDLPVFNIPRRNAGEYAEEIENPVYYDFLGYLPERRPTGETREVTEDAPPLTPDFDWLINPPVINGEIAASAVLISGRTKEFIPKGGKEDFVSLRPVKAENSDGSDISLKMPFTAFIGLAGLLPAAGKGVKGPGQGGGNLDGNAATVTSHIRNAAAAAVIAAAALPSYQPYFSVISDGQDVFNIPVREIMELMYIFPPEFEDDLYAAAASVNIPAPGDRPEAVPKLAEIISELTRVNPGEEGELVEFVYGPLAVSIPATIFLEIADIIPVDFASGTVADAAESPVNTDPLSPSAGHALRIFRTVPLAAGEYENVTLIHGNVKTEIPRAEFLSLMFILPEPVVPAGRTEAFYAEGTDISGIDGVEYLLTSEPTLNETQVWPLSLIDPSIRNSVKFNFSENQVPAFAPITAPDITPDTKTEITEVSINDLAYIDPVVLEFTGNMELSQVEVPDLMTLEDDILPKYKTISDYFEDISGIDEVDHQDGPSIDPKLINHIQSIKELNGVDSGDRTVIAAREIQALSEISGLIFGEHSAGLPPVYVNEFITVNRIEGELPEEIYFPEGEDLETDEISVFMPVQDDGARTASAQASDETSIDTITLINDGGTISSFVKVQPERCVSSFDADISPDGQITVAAPVSGPFNVSSLPPAVGAVVGDIASGGSISESDITEETFFSSAEKQIHKAIEGEQSLTEVIKENIITAIAAVIINLAMANGDMIVSTGKSEDKDRDNMILNTEEDDVASPVFMNRGQTAGTLYGAGIAEEDISQYTAERTEAEESTAAKETLTRETSIPVELYPGEKAAYPGGGAAGAGINAEKAIYPGQDSRVAPVYGGGGAEKHVYGSPIDRVNNGTPTYGEGLEKYEYSYTYGQYGPNNGYVVTEYTERGREVNVKVSQPYTIWLFLRRLFEMTISALGGGGDEEDIPRMTSRTLKKILPGEARYEDSERLSAYLSEWDEEDILAYVNSLAAGREVEEAIASNFTA